MSEGTPASPAPGGGPWPNNRYGGARRGQAAAAAAAKPGAAADRPAPPRSKAEVLEDARTQAPPPPPGAGGRTLTRRRAVVTQVACGTGFTAVVTADGDVWTWGCGADGRTGLDLGALARAQREAGVSFDPTAGVSRGVMAEGASALLSPCNSVLVPCRVVFPAPRDAQLRSATAAAAVRVLAHLDDAAAATQCPFVLLLPLPGSSTSSSNDGGELPDSRLRRVFPLSAPQKPGGEGLASPAPRGSARGSTFAASRPTLQPVSETAVSAPSRVDRRSLPASAAMAFKGQLRQPRASAPAAAAPIAEAPAPPPLLLPTFLHPSLARALAAGARFTGEGDAATAPAPPGTPADAPTPDDARSVRTDGSVGGGGWEATPRLESVGSGAGGAVLAPAIDAVEWATSAPPPPLQTQQQQQPAASGNTALAVVNPPADGTRVVQLAAGEAHVVACSRDGLVWAWGLNSHRQVRAAVVLRAEQCGRASTLAPPPFSFPQVGIGGAVVETPCQVSVHARLAAHDAAAREAAGGAEGATSPEAAAAAASAAALESERSRLRTYDDDAPAAAAAARDAAAGSRCTIDGTLPHEADPVVAVFAGAFHSICGTAAGALLAWGRNAEGALGLLAGAPAIQKTPEVLQAPASLRHHPGRRRRSLASAAAGARGGGDGALLPDLGSSAVTDDSAATPDHHGRGPLQQQPESGGLFVSRPWRRVLDVAGGKDFTLVLEADFPPPRRRRKRPVRADPEPDAASATFSPTGAVPPPPLEAAALEGGGGGAIAGMGDGATPLGDPTATLGTLGLDDAEDDDAAAAAAMDDAADATPLAHAAPSGASAPPLVASQSSSASVSGRIDLRQLSGGTGPPDGGSVGLPERAQSSSTRVVVSRSTRSAAAVAAAAEARQRVALRSAHLRNGLLDVAAAAERAAKVRAAAEEQLQSAQEWWRDALLHVHGSFDAYLQHNVDVQVRGGGLGSPLLCTLPPVPSTQRRTRDGIPPMLRGAVWALAIGNGALVTPAQYALCRERVVAVRAELARRTAAAAAAAAEMTPSRAFASPFSPAASTSSGAVARRSLGGSVRSPPVTGAHASASPQPPPRSLLAAARSPPPPPLPSSPLSQSARAGGLTPGAGAGRALSPLAATAAATAAAPSPPSPPAPPLVLLGHEATLGISECRHHSPRGVSGRASTCRPRPRPRPRSRAGPVPRHVDGAPLRAGGLDCGGAPLRPTPRRPRSACENERGRAPRDAPPAPPLCRPLSSCALTSATCRPWPTSRPCSRSTSRAARSSQRRRRRSSCSGGSRRRPALRSRPAAAAAAGAVREGWRPLTRHSRWPTPCRRPQSCSGLRHRRRSQAPLAGET